jgi:hypothetical protein
MVRNGPLIVTAQHTGSSNFAINLVGGGSNDLLVNEIGRYYGQVAVESVSKGRYRVAIDADGRWVLTFTQPIPSARLARPMPGRYSGHGARVVRLRSTRDLQPVVTATHRGQSNFAVNLIGYGNTSGNELLFNEIGNYHGQTLVDDVPQGHYLLAVEADGTWTISIRR